MYIILRDQSATLITITGQTIETMCTVDSLDELMAVCRANKASPITILVDVAHQSFHEEHVSHTHVTKRLAEVLPDYVMTTAVRTAPDTWLFVGIPQNRALERWIACLKTLPNPITGIGVHALEGIAFWEHVLKAMPAQEEWVVCVTHGKSGLMRQFAFFKNRFMLTRTGASSVQDTIKYIQRLSGQGRIRIVNIGPRPLDPSQEEGVTYQDIAPQALLKMLKVTALQPDVGIDGVYAAWLDKMGKLAHPMQHPQLDCSRWKKWLRYACVVQTILCFLGTMYMGYWFWDRQHDLTKDIVPLTPQVRTLDLSLLAKKIEGCLDPSLKVYDVQQEKMHLELVVGPALRASDIKHQLHAFETQFQAILKPRKDGKYTVILELEK